MAYPGLASIPMPELGSGTVKTVPAGPELWKHLPSDAEELAELAKFSGGIVIIFTLSCSSRVKKKYGPFGRARLLRRLEEWNAGRIDFIKKYSLKLSTAMRDFEKDYSAYKEEEVEEYAVRLRSLPEPPAGYYWEADDWCADEEESLRTEGTRIVRLWSDSFGPMPGAPAGD